MTTVAIMQPNYLPWAGYFALMDMVDTFVILDSVQYSRRCWQQRNRIKTPQGDLFLTVPVYSKGLRDQLIKDTMINYSSDPLTKHERTLKSVYSKAPFFNDYAEDLFEIYHQAPDKLMDLDLTITEWMRSKLGIATPIINSSTMNLTGSSADLIASICVEAGADTYISPPGSRAYLDKSSALQDNNIALHYLNYECQPYPQLYGDFIPSLSALDIMFNNGPESLNIIRAGVNNNIKID